MKRTVWVAHKKPHHRFHLAERFGEATVLMSDNDGKIDIFRDKKLTYRLYQKLKRSSPNDLMILCGDRVPCTLAALVFYQIHGCVNVLIYSERKKKYEIRKGFADIQKYIERGSGA